MPLDLLEAKEATVHSLGWVSPHLGELVLKRSPLLPLGVNIVLIDGVLGGNKMSW